MSDQHSASSHNIKQQNTKVMKLQLPKWFSQAQVGMFYHFGLYTLLGGNENVIRSTTSKADYRRLMEKFTAEQFDADAWVDCAVSMGAQYIMPTSRHAEGFCLWDSQLTRNKSTNTPCGRDLIAELAASCARKGVKFCVYFNFETWLNEGADIWNEKGMSYTEYMEGQLTELLTNYGPIGIVWFDHCGGTLTPGPIMERIVEHIKKLQPDCLVNNRSGIDIARGKFDYISTERTLPPRHPDNKNMIIECCDAMGVKSWGYHNEEAFWSTIELAKRASLCISRGYKYLLNVEPAPDGTIRPECVARAKGLGAWLDKNRSAISAGPSDLIPTDPNQEHEPRLGVATQSGNTLYLHLHDWPVADEVLVRAGGVPRAAGIQGDSLLTASAEARGILVRGLPDLPPPGHAPWIVTLEFEAPPVALTDKPVTRVLKPAPGEPVFLSPLDAELDGPAAYGVVSPHINRFATGNISIGLLHKNGDTISWRINSPEAREFEVYASFGTAKDQAKGEFELSCGESAIRGGTWLTEHYGLPASRQIGRLRLAEGENRIVFRVTKANFSDVHGISLVPIAK
ncbi:MAG: alpha-L-fucosidase [Verrucomicrobiae bacterium]